MAKPTKTPRAARAALDLPVTTATPAENINARLSVSLTESGLIDFDGMRASNRDKLKIAFSDPRLVAELGLAPAAAAAPAAATLAASDTALFTALLNMLYDGIASAAVVSARARGLAPNIAELLRVADDEKKAMAEAHLALLAKYDITSGAYAVEINALASVAMVCLAKYAAVKAALSAVPAVAPIVTASQQAQAAA